MGPGGEPRFGPHFPLPWGACLPPDAVPRGALWEAMAILPHVVPSSKSVQNGSGPGQTAGGGGVTGLQPSPPRPTLSTFQSPAHLILESWGTLASRRGTLG